MSRLMEYPAEIIPGRLYFLCAQQTSGPPPGVPAGAMCFWLDQSLVYEPFCADFGPCNLGHCWRFCQRLNHLLNEGDAQRQPVYLLVGPHPHKRANAAALVGIHSVLYLGKRAEEAYAPLRQLEPFVGFRDASCGVPTFTLGVADVIRGMARAKEVGFINWHAGEVFDLEEYEHYEQVENGDLNWIVPGKFMAFSGPSAQPRHFSGWRTFTPEDYIEYFREKGVTTVVRLNKKMYEASRFTANGVAHHDLYFPDGTCPSEPIMYRFLELAEREPSALAVHCKAGLGRTGVLICCYMIKHYGFTAEEAMAYIRVCRPGSVIGPQQHYLMQYAPRLLHEGRVARRAASIPTDPKADLALHLDPLPQAIAASGGRARSSSKVVINIEATSRNADILSAQNKTIAAVNTFPLRRSSRLIGTSSPAKSAASAVGTAVPEASVVSATSAAAAAAEAESLQLLKTAVARAMEPNHIISVPGHNGSSRNAIKSAAASPTKPAVEPEDEQSNKRVARGATTPPRQPTRAPMPSLASSPNRGVTTYSSGEISAASTPAGAKAGFSLVPPSSTKRVLAPNGQPRKIPLAVDFDSVAAASMLEDRDLADVDSLGPEDSWTVSSQPVPDKNYSATSKVGAFAAAAGRGATAFVEAFRSAVGAHRSSYGGRNERS